MTPHSPIRGETWGLKTMRWLWRSMKKLDNTIQSRQGQRHLHQNINVSHSCTRNRIKVSLKNLQLLTCPTSQMGSTELPWPMASCNSEKGGRYWLCYWSRPLSEEKDACPNRTLALAHPFGWMSQGAVAVGGVPHTGPRHHGKQ